MALKQQSGVSTRTISALVGATLLLSACAGSDTIDLTANKNIDDAIEAATGPLQDLNLRRQEIPPLLVKAAMNPYARAKKIKCGDIRAEVAELDTLLGPDAEPKSVTLASSDGGLGDAIARLDETEIPESDEIMDSAGSLVRDRILSTISSKTDILPFRSIIRSISGASRHQKKLAYAYEAGKLRRAYLKGLADMRFGERCRMKPLVVEAKATPPSTP
jgi:hypothetical protein